MPGRAELEKRVERIDELIHQLETGADPASQAVARELVGVLMALHGEGLDRIVGLARQPHPDADALIARFVGDEVIRSLLLLHGLHPVDAETRVREALDRTRPYLRSHGGNVELVRVGPDGTVRLRMTGTCHGCPSSSVTLKLAIEHAIHEAAPEVTAIVVDDDASVPSLVPLTHAREGHRSDAGRWETVPHLEQLPDGGVAVRPVAGWNVLFCRVGDATYAYGERCPACDRPFGAESLEVRVLRCPECGESFDVMEAGRGTGDSQHHLTPFPLLIELGQARVALPLAETVPGAR